MAHLSKAAAELLDDIATTDDRMNGEAAYATMVGWIERAQALPKPKTAEAHVCPEPQAQSDEYYCSTCHLRWDIKEGKPPCLK